MNTFAIPVEWIYSLPVVVTLVVGLAIAIKRWQEHPQVSKVAIFACVIGLFNSLFMPVITSAANNHHEAFYPPLMTIIRICISTLIIGLLLYAVFLGRKVKVAEEVSKSDEGVPISRIGSRGIVLRILTEIVRWAWRLMSLGIMLFAGTFIMAAPQGMFGLGLMALWLIVFTLLIWAWRHEGWFSLILLIVIGIPMGIDIITNLFNGRTIGSGQDATGYFVLIMSMLVGISWSLHALYKSTTTPWKRKLALVLAPVLAVLIIICIVAMRNAPFNP
jgi:hypothetical protein